MIYVYIVGGKTGWVAQCIWAFGEVRVATGDGDVRWLPLTPRGPCCISCLE